MCFGAQGAVGVWSVGLALQCPLLEKHLRNVRFEILRLLFLAVGATLQKMRGKIYGVRVVWGAVVRALLVVLVVGAPHAVGAQNTTTFVMGMAETTLELHPHKSYTVSEAQFFTALYEGLVGYDPATSRVVPGVAERWEITNEGRRYHFYLHADAAYWNGDTVEAQHFVQAWRALLDPAQSNFYSFLLDPVEGAAAYRTGEVSDPAVVRVEAPSPHELVIYLHYPAPYFLATLAHYSLSPIHPRAHRIEDWNALPAVPSNGPYVASSRSDSEIILIANRHYWDRENVAIPTIRIVRTNDAEQLAKGIATGEIDWVLSGLGFDDTIPPESVVVNPILGSSFLFFVADRPPWQDNRVRRALALLAPWDTIRDSAIYSFPTSSLIPRLPGYTGAEGIVQEDRNEALALLREAGYSWGEGLPALTIAVPDSAEDRRIATLLAEAWRQNINLTVHIQEIENNDYYSALKEGGYTIGRYTWVGDYLDPLTFLQLWTTESNLNDAKFSDAEYDELIAQSMREIGAARYSTLAQAERIVLEGALLMPINHSVALNFINLNRIGGWSINVLDIHPVKFLHFKKGAPIPGVAEVQAH